MIAAALAATGLFVFYLFIVLLQQHIDRKDHR